eukprot:SAG11_NODE_777_length_7218_cov_24.269420_4_plen_86_part_00
MFGCWAEQAAVAPASASRRFAPAPAPAPPATWGDVGLRQRGAAEPPLRPSTQAADKAGIPNYMELSSINPVYMLGALETATFVAA